MLVTILVNKHLGQVLNYRRLASSRRHVNMVRIAISIRDIHIQSLGPWRSFSIERWGY